MPLFLTEEELGSHSRGSEIKMGTSWSPLSGSERALSRVDTVVQKYRIERLIGIGGMAAVYADASERTSGGDEVSAGSILGRSGGSAPL